MNEWMPKLMELALFIPVLVISLGIHEWAHAYAAYKLGDNTANSLGRMTINPIAHIDMVGTLIFPIVGFLSSLPLFGWATPVPVNPNNLKNERKDMAFIAAAGPASNIILAVLCTFILSQMPGDISTTTQGMMGATKKMLFMYAIPLNIALAIFNLLPIYPLDGSRILDVFISRELSAKIKQNAGIIQMVFLLAIFTGALRFIAYPIHIIYAFLLKLFNIY